MRQLVTLSRQNCAAVDAGFTLLELLIAVAVFAVVGAMAYGGLHTVMNQQQRTNEHSQRLADLQLAYRIMQRDLEQLVDRQIRNEYGDRVAGLVGGSGYEGVEFSRAGYPNPASFLRSEIQRVSYIADQDQLLRRSWRVLDRGLDSVPDEEVLIEAISDFAIRFLDESDEWQDNWPARQTLGQTAPALPRAVEVRVELTDLGVIRWLFRVPDNYRSTTVTAGASGTGTAGDSQDEDA
jgi:general secretion pathway protein J